MAKRHTFSLPIGTIEFSVYRSKHDIEAIYIRIRNNKVAKSEEAGPNGEAVIDLDSRGQVVGIEMLQPGHLTVQDFNKITKQYDIEQLKGVKIDHLQEAFA